jgi:two-component system chemotaxis sensor kinase CheA
MPQDEYAPPPTDLEGRVEALARLAVLIDAGDRPGLAALQEQASALAAELGKDQAGEGATLVRSIAALAGSIVAGKAADPGAALGEIGTLVDRLQTALTRAGEAPDAGAESAGESDENTELIGTWVSDCEGMLAELEGRLLALERAPADSEVLADIRRMMHTLKGECGVLSLSAPQALCHEAESLIDARLGQSLVVPIDPLLELLDWLNSYVKRLAADQRAKPADHQPLLARLVAARESAKPAQCAAPAAPVAPATAPANAAATVDNTPVDFAPAEGTEENLPDFLCEAKDHLAGSEGALLALESDRKNKELINTVFRAFHTIKGVAGFMALQPIVSLAHSAEQLLDGARAGTIALERAEMDLVLAACDMMARLLGVLEGASGPTRADFTALVRKLDAAAAAPGGAAPERVAKAAPAVATAPPVAPPPAAPAAEQDPSGGQKLLRKTDQTVKVNTARMDSLVTMVGELVIAQQMVLQDIAGASTNGQRIQRTLGHMGKMIRDLQEVSMSLRMVNLKGTFQKMTRLVRDVSQKAGKPIEVVTEGEDVELDRNVVEAITDPLVHMIRNACDHGIDDPAERRALGKPPVGRVTLRAYHAGGSIVIEIADDGRGLRREKLIAKAKSKGLLPADLDESSVPDSEVFALIFLPGFSTAEKVTDLSGRGVGMDVVRRNIEALRGKVEIRSTPGQGTTFLMRLPLTMAIIDGMVVRVGAQRFVLPTLSIQQSFRPRADEVKTVVGAGEMVQVRGSMLPIHRLARVLDLHDGLEQITDALLIVLEADDSRFCLLVDEILGQHQVVIKTLDHTGQRLRGVSGGAILGDGRVALILDVSQVVALAREGAGSTRRTNVKTGRVELTA